MKLSEEKLRIQNFFWFSQHIDALKPVEMPESAIVCYRIETDELEIWHKVNRDPNMLWRVWFSFSKTYLKELLGEPESYGRIVLGEL